MPAAFGLSVSSVSRRFVRASARHLRTFCERRLEREEFVALVLDGKTFADEAMVIALGITLQGQKKVLGFVQTATENERVCAAFLRELSERGLQADHGLLKALQAVFGRRAVVQRCQWHKRENVLTHLPKAQHPTWRRKLQATYAQPRYDQAKAALLAVREAPRLVNASAGASLDEGLEETLALHRLGLFPVLGVSLKTTNGLESLHAQLGQLTEKVNRWRIADQKHRCVASALLTMELRLRRIQGYRHVPLLRAVLQADIGRAESAEGISVAG